MAERGVIGLVASCEAVAKRPEALDMMQDEIGLALLQLRGPVALSPELMGRNPLGSPSRGAVDDSVTRRAIEEAHRRGIAVWLGGFGGLRALGPAPREMTFRDLRGRAREEIPSVPYASEGLGTILCPSNEALIAWNEAANVELYQRYAIDGTFAGLFRYQHPSYPAAVFGCACSACRARAEALGYDFATLRDGALKVWEALEALDAAKVREVVALNLQLFDFLDLLAGAEGFLGWLEFRARVLDENMRRYRDAVHRAVAREVVFAVQGAVPTFALLAGHRYREMASACDAVVPINQHIGSLFLSNFIALANLLCKQAEGLREEEALEALYMLFGYEDLPLPRTLKGLGAPLFQEAARERIRMEDLPPEQRDNAHIESAIECLPQILERELRKGRLLGGEGMVSYPLLKGGGWPREVVQYAKEAAFQAGHQGILFQGSNSLLPSELWETDLPGALWP